MNKTEALSLVIEKLIEQRNALQKTINELNEQRNRPEKPHLKGEEKDG